MIRSKAGLARGETKEMNGALVVSAVRRTLSPRACFGSLARFVAWSRDAV